jgi:hypothetical protein
VINFSGDIFPGSFFLFASGGCVCSAGGLVGAFFSSVGLIFGIVKTGNYVHTKKSRTRVILFFKSIGTL